MLKLALPTSRYRTLLRLFTFASGVISFCFFAIIRPETKLNNAINPDYFSLPIGLLYFSSFTTMFGILLIAVWRTFPTYAACCFRKNALGFLELLLDIGLAIATGASSIISVQRTLCPAENTQRYPQFCHYYSSAIAFSFFAWFGFSVSTIWNIFYASGFLDDPASNSEVATAIARHNRSKGAAISANSVQKQMSMNTTAPGYPASIPATSTSIPPANRSTWLKNPLSKVLMRRVSVSQRV